MSPPSRGTGWSTQARSHARTASGTKPGRPPTAFGPGSPPNVEPLPRDPPVVADWVTTSAGSLHSIDISLGSAPRPASVVTRRSRRASEFTWATSIVPSRQSSAWVTRRGPTCSASSSPRSAARARAWASKGSASTRVSSLPCQTKASSSTWTKSGCPASKLMSPGGSPTSMWALTSRSGSR